VAFRLSTTGTEVSVGSGLGVSEGEDVSVAASVGVSEAVSVGAGRVTVSVTGAKAVLVGGSALAVGTAVEVELHADEARIIRIRKKELRFMKCIYSCSKSLFRGGKIVPRHNRPWNDSNPR
jgi:hypothetical protein